MSTKDLVIDTAKCTTKRVWQTLRKKEHVILLVLLSLNLVIRVACLSVMRNPDATRKWGLARDLLHGVSIPAADFTHHAARWAINVPIMAFQAVFGEAPWVYYLPILAFSSLQLLFTYLIGCQIRGPAVGALAVLLYVPLPFMTYVGSHLMPSVFESTFVLAAAWALCRAFDQPGRRWVVWSCVLFCMGYFAKETVVLFLPGLLIALWFGRRKLWEPIGYGAGFGLVVGLETLAYRLVYGFKFGRLSIIKNHHFNSSKIEAPVKSFGALFERYADLPTGFNELFFVGLALSILAVVFYKRLRLERTKLAALLLVCWGFFLMSTFALRSLDPPRLAQPLRDRYLFGAGPMLALIIASTLAGVTPKKVWACIRRRTPLLVLAAGAVICVLVLPSRLKREHPFVSIHRYEKQLQQAFRDGVPIVSPDRKPNAMRAVENVFLTVKQKRRALLTYARQGGRRVQVLVDRKSPKYKRKSKRARSKAIRRALRRPRLEISFAHNKFHLRHRGAKPKGKRKRNNKKRKKQKSKD